MIDTVEERFRVYYQKEFRRSDTSVRGRVVGGLREDLDVERADRAELIAELDEARLPAEGRDVKIVVDNYVHEDAPPAHPEGPPLTPAQELVAALLKTIELQAEVIGLKDQLKKTSDALEVERRHNFADGSVMATWHVERTEFQRRIELLTRERDDAVCVYEELEADFAQQMGILTPDELARPTPSRRYNVLIHLHRLLSY
ncbi:hypothetical protein R1sor_002940 [Riccia sorocarpa]|uniref:Uncharacterized protein n=1 Tax=Riccia sorocarpa TaxID=122646 RepID=A0ABD3H055_9MARC